MQSGVVKAAVAEMSARGVDPLRAAIGPSIGPCCFEVGARSTGSLPIHVPLRDELADAIGEPASCGRRSTRRYRSVEVGVVYTLWRGLLFAPKRQDTPAYGSGRMDELIAMRLRETLDRVHAAARRSGRSPDDVQLLAVTKGHPAAVVASAYQTGHRRFGESRAQELGAKAADLPPDVEWHFIGPLQRNKVKGVRPLVAALHSIDRDSLAVSWDGGPPALIQVRLGGEPTKHGYEPADAHRAVANAVGAGVDVIGLMTIPPPSEPAGDAAPLVQRVTFPPR